MKDSMRLLQRRWRYLLLLSFVIVFLFPHGLVAQPDFVPISTPTECPLDEKNEIRVAIPIPGVTEERSYEVVVYPTGPKKGGGTEYKQPLVVTKQCYIVDGLAEYLAGFYRYSIGVIGIIAVAMMILGGFVWATSAGNEGRIGRGKEMMTSAALGFVIALTSFLILKTVNPALVNLAQINVTEVPRIDQRPPGGTTVCSRNDLVNGRPGAYVPCGEMYELPRADEEDPIQNCVGVWLPDKDKEEMCLLTREYYGDQLFYTGGYQTDKLRAEFEGFSVDGRPIDPLIGEIELGSGAFIAQPCGVGSNVEIEQQGETYFVDGEIGTHCDDADSFCYVEQSPATPPLFPYNNDQIMTRTASEGYDLRGAQCWD
jgi:hypothetical protein